MPWDRNARKMHDRTAARHYKAVLRQVARGSHAGHIRFEKLGTMEEAFHTRVTPNLVFRLDRWLIMLSSEYSQGEIIVDLITSHESLRCRRKRRIFGSNKRPFEVPLINYNHEREGAMKMQALFT